MFHESLPIRIKHCPKTDAAQFQCNIRPGFVESDCIRQRDQQFAAPSFMSRINRMLDQIAPRRYRSECGILPPVNTVRSELSRSFRKKLVVAVGFYGGRLAQSKKIDPGWFVFGELFFEE